MLCTGSPACSCGMAYISEARRRLETRLKEHQDAFQRGMLETLAVAEQLGRIMTPADGKRPQWWTRPNALEKCHSGKPSTSIHMTPTALGNSEQGHQVCDPWVLDGCLEDAGNQDRPHQSATSIDTC